MTTREHDVAAPMTKTTDDLARPDRALHDAIIQDVPRCLCFNARVPGMPPAAALKKYGPTVRVRVNPPSGPILYAQIDSGAESSCIAASAARRLNLRAYRTIEAVGVHGREKTMVYRCRIAILDGNDAPFGEFDLPEVFNVTLGGESSRFEFIVGRDVLQHYLFVVHGPTGRFVLVPL